MSNYEFVFLFVLWNVTVFGLFLYFPLRKTWKPENASRKQQMYIPIHQTHKLESIKLDVQNLYLNNMSLAYEDRYGYVDEYIIIDQGVVVVQYNIERLYPWSSINSIQYKRRN